MSIWTSFKTGCMTTSSEQIDPLRFETGLGGNQQVNTGESRSE